MLRIYSTVSVAINRETNKISDRKLSDELKFTETSQERTDRIHKQINTDNPTHNQACFIPNLPFIQNEFYRAGFGFNLAKLRFNSKLRKIWCSCGVYSFLQIEIEPLTSI